MLFDPKFQGKIKLFWGALCILIIASMILMYLPSLFQ